MAKVQGKSLAKLDKSEKLRVLNNHNMLFDIGKTIAVDAFLGNTDRISKRYQNTGNFMLSEGGSIPMISAIDNAAVLDPEKVENIEFTLDKEGPEKLSLYFVNKLTKGGEDVDPRPGQERVDRLKELAKQITPSIEEGIIAGAKRLMRIVKDTKKHAKYMAGFEKKHSMPRMLLSYLFKKFRNNRLLKAGLEKRVKMFRERLKSTGWDKTETYLNN